MPVYRSDPRSKLPSFSVSFSVRIYPRLQSLIASAMVLHGTIDSLIDFFSFTAWIFYGGAMLALIVMRYTKPNHPRPYKVPIIIPVVVLVISVYLVAAPIFETPRVEYLYALLFIFAGMLFYVPFVKLGMTPRFMSKSREIKLYDSIPYHTI